MDIKKLMYTKEAATNRAGMTVFFMQHCRNSFCNVTFEGERVPREKIRIRARTPNLMSCGMRGGSRRGPPQGVPAVSPGAGGGSAGWLEGAGGWMPAGTRA